MWSVLARLWSGSWLGCCNERVVLRSQHTLHHWYVCCLFDPYMRLLFFEDVDQLLHLKLVEIGLAGSYSCIATQSARHTADHQHHSIATTAVLDQAGRRTCFPPTFRALLADVVTHVDPTSSRHSEKSWNVTGRQRIYWKTVISSSRKRNLGRKGMAQSTQLVSCFAGRASAARVGRSAGNVNVPRASATARASSARDLRPENVDGDFAVDHTCIGEAGLCSSARPAWSSCWTNG